MESIEDFWDDGSPPAHASDAGRRGRSSYKLCIDVSGQRIGKMSEDVVSDILDKAREIDEEAETLYSHREDHFEQSAWDACYSSQSSLIILLPSMEDAERLEQYANARIAGQIFSELSED